MITFTRRTARLVRKVFRQALEVGQRGPGPAVLMQAGADGLHVRAFTASAAASFIEPGSFADETIAIPFELLTDCAGASEAVVQIENMSDGRIMAGWQDQGVPLVRHYEGFDPQELLQKYPPQPSEVRHNSPELLTALRDAMDIADRESSRYATSCVRLRGSDGTIAATDGRQLLIQSGFSFPFVADILVPRTKVFGCADVATADTFSVGSLDAWFVVSVGAWTFHFRLHQDGLFPRVEDHIVKPDIAIARMLVGDSDAAFLQKALSRLPCNDNLNKPVTIDLNGSVAIRAQRDDDCDVTEILLRQSAREGEQVRLNTNRQYLAHALKLGFRELSVYQPDAPVLCHDQRRHYVWALLDPKSAIKPNDNAIRVESPGTDPQRHDFSPTSFRSHTTTMPTTTNKPPRENQGANGHAASTPPTHDHSATVAPTKSPASSLSHAIALRETLHAAAKQAGDLVRTLKAEKRQSRIVRSTLASLRSLEAIDA